MASKRSICSKRREDRKKPKNTFGTADDPVKLTQEVLDEIFRVFGWPTRPWMGR